MIIKPNTYYRTRDGRKVYVAGIAPDEIDCIHSQRVVGFLYRRVEGGSPTVIMSSWSLRGRYSVDNVSSPADLTAEWREPITITLWANVYHNNIHTYHDSKQAADGAANSYRLACVCISGTEIQD